MAVGVSENQLKFTTKAARNIWTGIHLSFLWRLAQRATHARNQIHSGMNCVQESCGDTN
jgi:hypothetical protein